MKSRIRTLSFALLLSGAIGAQAAPILVPNGDFSTPGGEDWTQAESSVEGGGSTIITYETSGGNPGGYGKIDNTAGSWGGVLVSEGGSGPNPATGGGIELSTLGLTAGETYTFSLDMIDFGAGGTMAGIKLESWSETGYISDSTDQNFATTTSWATYDYDYTIDAAATRIKVVPLLSGSQNEIVGFDNIQVDNTAVVPPPFVASQIENGGFEVPNGVGWGTVQGTPVYNTTGGNPDGHVVLDGTAEFAVLYAFNNSEVTFASLGLAPGDTYMLQMDIKLITGAWGGGYRLEGPAGFVIDDIFDVIGNGSTWETYSVELTVPAGPTQSKFGLRPGGSVMAFDNVSIVRPGLDPFAVCIDQGTVVSWTPTSAVNSYQPQASDDNTNWTDLGPRIAGDAISSVFDEDGAAFYRVQEYMVDTAEIVRDGGLEIGNVWEYINNAPANHQPPVDVEDAALAFAGDWFVRLAADTGTGTDPKSSIMNQLNSPVVAGGSYDFSFQAYGESRVEAEFFYSIKWLVEATSVVVNELTVNFDDLAIGQWTEITNPGLVVPAGADAVLIEIICGTGAVAGRSGSFRVDEVSLVGETSTFLQDLPATPGDGVVLSWPTAVGASYQVKSSADLMTFTDLGGPMVGDGSTMTLGEAAASKKFFQVVETP